MLNTYSITSVFLFKDTKIGTITAIDIDDPATANARIGYAIGPIVSAMRDTFQPPPNASALFRINSESGEIYLTTPARGFYGQWAVDIEAFDHGHEWDSHIQLRSLDTFTFTVEPYNFHTPAIVAPAANAGGMLHRLRYTLTTMKTVKYPLFLLT